ncbi:MAG: SPASM domain-containing protein [Alphaproteobacteria bacterium]
MVAVKLNVVPKIFEDYLSEAVRGELDYDDFSSLVRLLRKKNYDLAVYAYLGWVRLARSPLLYVACADFGDLLVQGGDYRQAAIAYQRSLFLNPSYDRASKGLEAVRLPVANWSYGLMNIELTNKCPMKCIMCPRTNNMTRAQGFMDFDVFSRVVDQFVVDVPGYSQQLVWLHHFGESLLHPDFEKMINYAAGKGMAVSLSLNPLMVTNDVATRLLSSRLLMIYASLDGHDDESFEKIRGVKNAYIRSKQNLLALLERKVATGWRTRVVVSMIDFPDNAASINSLRQYWSNIPGVDEFMVKPFTNWTGDCDDVNSLVATTVQQSSFVSCNYPWEHMSVTWDGDVVACCYDYDKKYVLGNARETPLKEIWNGQPMVRLRSEFRSGNVTCELCRSCRYLRAVNWEV